MANPLVIAAGAAVTLNSSHALKVSKITVVAASATAVSFTLTDLGGNALVAPIFVPATPNTEVTADYVIPVVVPGGTNLASTNAIATTTGAGGTAYIYHR
jgi:hypothetical protein